MRTWADEPQLGQVILFHLSFGFLSVVRAFALFVGNYRASLAEVEILLKLFACFLEIGFVFFHFVIPHFLIIV